MGVIEGGRGWLLLCRSVPRIDADVDAPASPVASPADEGHPLPFLILCPLPTSQPPRRGRSWLPGRPHSGLDPELGPLPALPEASSPS